MAFTIQTPNSAAAWRPDHFEFAPDDVVGEAAIIQTSTRAGEIQGDAPSVRVAFVTDDEAENVDEAGTFSEAQPELSEALIWTTKIGELLRISREQYLQPSTPDQLAQSCARAIIRKADQNYLTQAAPVAPDNAPAAGLLNWPGIVDGGAVSENLDALIDLIAELEINLATPSHIILGPLGWAEARKWKTALNYNSNLLGAGTTDATPMMLSLPVTVNKSITDYSGLVVDQRAVVSAYGTVSVATSMDRYFDSDSVALKSHWRTGHTVPRPDRLGRFTVAPAGS
ncbi:phage major capsid protein [Mycobacterium sp. URHD0025]|uniref:phage major capsid protein n=1 Tax=Mycobacterium sp. URHD0025 TaxID=1298864 RepID=UPI0003FFF33E|nr:phage major capsid protein [Mycobacterium sp. URHD0025]